jgi:hypothetical protein
MSILLHIVCRETNQELAIGQYSMSLGSFYVWTGEQREMEKLARFLLATMGKKIEVLHERDVESADFDEFEPDDEEDPS